MNRIMLITTLLVLSGCTSMNRPLPGFNPHDSGWTTAVGPDEYIVKWNYGGMNGERVGATRSLTQISEKLCATGYEIAEEWERDWRPGSDVKVLHQRIKCNGGES